MKAALLRKNGKPSVLKIEDIPEPMPNSGQVRIKIQTIGINYAEILSRKGLYGWAPKKPYVLGMEAFGTIDAVGPNINRKIGEEVVIGTQYGCYADCCRSPESTAGVRLLFTRRKCSIYS